MRYTWILICFLALLVAPNDLLAQSSGTDVYLLGFELDEGTMNVQTIEYLSSFNQGRYTNQPCFINEDKVLVTSRDASGQTDIVELDIYEQNLRKLTATLSRSEYSPKLAPSGAHFSVVRVEDDGVTQSLWLYPADLSHGGARVLSNVDNIGYYEWLSDEIIAYFGVEREPQLVVANVETGEAEVLMHNIGRTLKINREGELVFVHKLSDDFWYLKAFDLEDRRARIISQIESEDFDLMSNGAYLCTKGSKIYYLDEDLNQDWIEAVDLSRFGLDNLSRITTFHNQIIIVNAP